MIPSHTGFSFFLFSFFSTLLKCLWVSHSFFFDTSIHFSSYVICLLSNHSTFLCEWQPIVKPSQLCNSRTTSFTSQTIVNCHGDLSEPVKAITTKTEHMERHTVFIYMGALKMPQLISDGAEVAKLTCLRSRLIQTKTKLERRDTQKCPILINFSMLNLELLRLPRTWDSFVLCINKVLEFCDMTAWCFIHVIHRLLFLK